jgi:hypothetical protein
MVFLSESEGDSGNIFSCHSERSEESIMMCGAFIVLDPSLRSG